MAGNPGDDFEALARRYWAAWGDALRGAVPGAGGMPGAAGMPGLGAMPGFGGMPAFGAVPGAAAMPGFGAMPGMEAMAGMGGAEAATFGADAWRQLIDGWSQVAQGGRAQADDAIAHFNSQARDWYARMQEVAARFAGQDSNAADVAKAWKDALGASGTNPFPEMLRSMQGHGLQGLGQWVESASPWLESLRSEGRSWMHLPAFGPAREQQERMQALARHMAHYQQASAEYNALLLKAQEQAFPIFEAKLAARNGPDQRIESARALFDLWIDAAEEAYAEAALSPEFRRVYGALVNAQMRVRAGVQRMVEDACAQVGMPTRTELDGAHRRLAELEREVRRLRDALRQTRVVDGTGQGGATTAGRSVGPKRPAARKAATRSAATRTSATGKAATKKAVTRTAATKKAATKKAATKKAATRKAASRTAATGKVASKNVATRKVAARKTATKKTAARKAVKKGGR